MEYLQNILITLGLFFSVAIVVIALLNFILRYQLIRKDQTDPEILKGLGRSFDYKLASLKWGTILFSAGLGLILISFVPAAQDLESPLPYGIELLFLAVGFLSYYHLARKKNPQD